MGQYVHGTCKVIWWKVQTLKSERLGLEIPPKLVIWFRTTYLHFKTPVSHVWNGAHDSKSNDSISNTMQTKDYTAITKVRMKRRVGYTRNWDCHLHGMCQISSTTAGKWNDGSITPTHSPFNAEVTSWLLGHNSFSSSHGSSLKFNTNSNLTEV